MTNNNPVRAAYRKPKSDSFIVTNQHGQPLGRMNMTDAFGPVPLQFAACFTLPEAIQVAERASGIVKPAPIFDDSVGDWVIPAAGSHTAQ